MELPRAGPCLKTDDVGPGAPARGGHQLSPLGKAVWEIQLRCQSYGNIPNQAEVDRLRSLYNSADWPSRGASLDRIRSSPQDDWDDGSIPVGEPWTSAPRLPSLRVLSHRLTSAAASAPPPSVCGLAVSSGSAGEFPVFAYRPVRPLARKTRICRRPAPLAERPIVRMRC
ncbi:hypothetical protein AAFF_G00068840 [Aldrovandia affinis]|uniref:Uncharacterized protein n=1 Tax=Aldrovandia affinis TaxID=143900 RepID=A0AAD7RZ58_9TELE|nr:hypothetical protein AAFF_G00068840 [Aldrovandia affinis]